MITIWVPKRLVEIDLYNVAAQNPAALAIAQGSQSSVEACYLLCLQNQLQRLRRFLQGVLFNAIAAIQREIRLCAQNTDAVRFLIQLEAVELTGDLVRHFQINVHVIKRVILPQIDFFHLVYLIQII